MAFWRKDDGWEVAMDGSRRTKSSEFGKRSPVSALRVALYHMIGLGAPINAYKADSGCLFARVSRWSGSGSWFGTVGLLELLG